MNVLTFSGALTFFMSRAGSVLFSPHRIGPMVVPNRFIRSPICMGSADKNGMPDKSELDHMIDLAKGKCGLIVPGFMYPVETGRCFIGQTGFTNDAHADAWKDTVEKIHALGSKIVFQIAHAGCASRPEGIEGEPRGPSGFLPGTRAMTIAEIEELIQSYADATKRLVRIGADGIMIHCAHGYGLAQFLSPYANKRTDKYGGSVENRARIVREICAVVRKAAPEGFAIIAKINGHDGRPGGTTPDLCAQNVAIMRKEGVHLFEISCGFLNAMVMSRAILREGLTIRNGSKEDFERWNGLRSMINPEFPFWNGYTQKYAEVVRRANPGVDLAIVGGNRDFRAMEELVEQGKCEMVSIGRPFIRDPFLIKKFLEGKVDASACVSCNQCFCFPVRCRFPSTE